MRGRAETARTTAGRKGGGDKRERGEVRGSMAGGDDRGESVQTRHKAGGAKKIHALEIAPPLPIELEVPLDREVAPKQRRARDIQIHPVRLYAPLQKHHQV